MLAHYLLYLIGENKLKSTGFIIMTLLLAASCSSKPNIKLSIKPNPYYGTLSFVIQATENKVIVTGVVVNRGNCKLPAGTAAEIGGTVNLSFGESYLGFGSCPYDNAKEIEVTTNAGSFIFSF